MDAADESPITDNCSTPAAASYPNAAFTPDATPLLSVGSVEQENNHSKFSKFVATLYNVMIKPRYLQ